MAHFSAYRALNNGLVKRCARHDSNVRPLPTLSFRTHSSCRLASPALSRRGGAKSAVALDHPAEALCLLEDLDWGHIGGAEPRFQLPQAGLRPQGK